MPSQMTEDDAKFMKHFGRPIVRYLNKHSDSQEGKLDALACAIHAKKIDPALAVSVADQICGSSGESQLLDAVREFNCMDLDRFMEALRLFHAATRLVEPDILQGVGTSIYEVLIAHLPPDDAHIPFSAVLRSWRGLGYNGIQASYEGRTFPLLRHADIMDSDGVAVLEFGTEDDQTVSAKLQGYSYTPLQIRLPNEGSEVLLSPVLRVDETQLRLQISLQIGHGTRTKRAFDKLNDLRAIATDSRSDHAFELLVRLSSAMEDFESITVRQGSLVEQIHFPYDSLTVRENSIEIGRIIIPLNDALDARWADDEVVFWEAENELIWINCQEGELECALDLVEALQEFLNCPTSLNAGKFLLIIDGEKLAVNVHQVRLPSAPFDIGDCIEFGYSYSLPVESIGEVDTTPLLETHSISWMLTTGEVVTIEHIS